MTPLATLQFIADRLGQSTPIQLIEDLAPRSTAEAVTWARRLPGWDEHRGQFPDQVIGIARTVSRRAMKEHRLAFNDAGQVVEQTDGKPWQTPRPTTFPLQIAGGDLLVWYTRDYFIGGGMDSLCFTNHEEPARSHCLSDTGYWHSFAPHDAVEACGGPEAFARLLAEARIAGREQAFMEGFEGKRPEVKTKRKVVKQAVVEEMPEQLDTEAPETAAVPPQHASQVVERRGKPSQGLLF